MSIRKVTLLPPVPAMLDAVSFRVPEKLSQKFDAAIRMEAAGENVIDLFGEIGMPEWMGGVTAQSVQRQLRGFGDNPVSLNINSPGGSYWEGQAIYNMLAAHKAKVSARIVGMAGSAAGLIAMAADDIEIAKAGWFMAHEAFALVVANKTELADVIDLLTKVDDISADIYAERSGQTRAAIVKLMAAGEMLTGDEAVAKGFADRVMSKEPARVSVEQSAGDRLGDLLNIVDDGLRAAGHSRGGRRSIKQELSGMLRATGPGTPRAATLSVSADSVKHLLAEISALKETKLS